MPLDISTLCKYRLEEESKKAKEIKESEALEESKASTEETHKEEK